MPDPQQQQQPQAPQPGSPEHTTAMAAKFDQGQQKPPAEPNLLKGQRPEWLPDKFKSPEDMAKAYTELEKKLGAPPQQGQQQPAQGQQQPAQGQQQPQQFDFQAVAAEFMEKGALSEETYAALEKQGVSKALADSFISGQQAAASTRATAVFAEAGGEESYRKMVEWGSSNMTPEEVDLFNQALAGTAAAAKLAVAGLKQKYEASVGKPPSLLDGGQGSTAVGYESQAQMKADMKDPRYKTDPAFRAKVVSKLAQTTAF